MPIYFFIDENIDFTLQGVAIHEYKLSEMAPVNLCHFFLLHLPPSGELINNTGRSVFYPGCVSFFPCTLKSYNVYKDLPI